MLFPDYKHLHSKYETVMFIVVVHPVNLLENHKTICLEANFALLPQLDRLLEYKLGQIVYLSTTGLWQTALLAPFLCDGKFFPSLAKEKTRHSKEMI